MAKAADSRSNKPEVAENETVPDAQVTAPLQSEKPTCGIVMPISATDGCSESHWKDVLLIITEAVESAGFKANLVSNSAESVVIHKTIIENLYNNPIVVCDVSAKNPNVMFELGLRLAFDKATVVVKDNKTDYSFDTSPIKHLPYPRDLRYQDIVAFRKNLSSAVKSTYDKSVNDPNYSTFLKHFGPMSAVTLDSKNVTVDQYLLDEFRAMKTAFVKMANNYSEGDVDSKSSQAAIAESRFLIRGFVESAVKLFVESGDYRDFAKRTEFQMDLISSIHRRFPREVAALGKSGVAEMVKLAFDGVVPF